MHKIKTQEGSIVFDYTVKNKGEIAGKKKLIELSIDNKKKNSILIYLNSDRTKNNLSVRVVDNKGVIHETSKNIDYWEIGEKHQVAVTWNMKEKIVLYIDGQKANEIKDKINIVGEEFNSHIY